MKKENMLAAMMFGGAGGGGGGGSSSVLDVVCTVTETDGVASYDYSVSAEDAVAAVNAGKVIRLTVSARGFFSGISDAFNCDYSTVNVNNITDISFLIASGERRVMPAALVKIYKLRTAVPEWTEESNDYKKFDLIQTGFTDSVDSVPRLTADGDLELDKIQKIIELDGSVAQLAMGAMASAGTAIGTTINDPTTLDFLTELEDTIIYSAIRGKPCKLFDTYSGTIFGFDIISTTHEEIGNSEFRLTSMTATTALIVLGNLCHVTLSFAFTYVNADSTELTQVQLAAYCDSHAITFV